MWLGVGSQKKGIKKTIALIFWINAMEKRRVVMKPRLKVVVFLDN
jgi:hypothetical protein